MQMISHTIVSTPTQTHQPQSRMMAERGLGRGRHDRNVKKKTKKCRPNLRETDFVIIIVMPSKIWTHSCSSNGKPDKEMPVFTERCGSKSTLNTLPPCLQKVYDEDLARHVINETWHTSNATSCRHRRKKILLDQVNSFFDDLYESAICISKETRPFWLDYHTDSFVTSQLTVNMLHSSTPYIQPGPHKPVQAARSRVDNMDMSSELVRYGTFHTWSHLAAWPNRLAAAGFYYRNQGDEVVCFSCGCTCSGWQPGMEPMVVHRRQSPSCMFVNGQAGNIPVIASPEARNHLIQVSGSESRHTPPTQQSQPRHPRTNAVAAPAGFLSLPPPFRRPDSTAGPQSLAPAQMSVPGVIAPQPQVLTPILQTTQPTETVHDSNLGISTDRPKNPTYAVTSARVKSYVTWPHSSPTPVDLAEAGFFYNGQGDSVRCFFCGTGLRNWDSGDNAWVEHARWSPQCVYLVQHQGRDFVDLVQSLSSGGNQVEYSQVQDILRDMRPKAALVPQKGAVGVAPAPHVSTEAAGGASSDQHEDDSLVEENERLKQQTMCKICLDKEVSIVFLPCGHLVCCVECAPALRKCPMCRANIRGTVKAFMS
ncbi:E3 ubiquitin-protein ligase XIAP-like isoform X2 [Haliotis rubra]|nr:E3 ubiquitin-protein ligase XIAP-like isoform X2 [Haliotis rubra]XP_046572471.1 E3 ubiquitin-protein ligase XIAP-like isoform X2 [Haliotis rubra]